MSLSEIVQRFKQALEAKDYETLDALLADDFKAKGPTVDLDNEQFLAYVQLIYTAFPDMAFHFGPIAEDGATVRLPAQETGTHTGTLDLTPFGVPLTLPPTGKKFSLPISTYELVINDGKITHLQENVTEGGGMQGILTQLGVNFS